jgi:hypothetical protein
MALRLRVPEMPAEDLIEMLAHPNDVPDVA